MSAAALLTRLERERDPLRCGLCDQPSARPVCRRCSAVLAGEKPRPPRRPA